MEELERRCTEESRNEEATLMERIRGQGEGGGTEFHGINDRKAGTRETVGLWGENEVKRHRSRLNLCKVSVILQMSARLSL